MKKHLLCLSVLLLFCASSALASIITNTNQSTLFFRLLSRNASTDIDAVYYNPAGLTKLADGFHFGLHNQTIFQEKTVIDAFPLLNNDTYVGKVNVPIFPSAFFVYKNGPLALSFGFGPNAGGGSAEFGDGLPSFEIPFSLLPAGVSALGVPTTAYSLDMSFEGTSIYYGFQGNVSYAFGDLVSVGGGVRYILARNTYKGYIRNVMIDPFFPALGLLGQMVPASQFFTAVGQPALAALTADKELNVKQVGSAITPILSVNVTPIRTLNFSLKYEFNTNLELENQTTIDDTGLYPDGAKERNDIPAILSLGLQYEVMPNFRAHLSYNLFFDKNADWEGRQDLVDNNTYDLALGLEYDLASAVSLSAGIMRTQFGLSEQYQTDFSHEMSCTSLGVGARLRMIPKLDLDLGVLYILYGTAQRSFTGVTGPYTETYERSTLAFAVGFGYHL
jgi:long-chain fatty acid transport protein